MGGQFVGLKPLLKVKILLLQLLLPAVTDKEMLPAIQDGLRQRGSQVTHSS